MGGPDGAISNRRKNIEKPQENKVLETRPVVGES